MSKQPNLKYSPHTFNSSHKKSFEASPYGVAKFYGSLLKHLIIDMVDSEHEKRIQKIGVKVTVANTIMKSVEDAVNLAKVVIEAE